MSETAKERTGWRDERISQRHRLWGVECKATDIDFLLLEYSNDFGKITPAAIIEYKHEYAPPQMLNNCQYLALKTLGDKADLPIFAVRYNDSFTQFLVVPVNKYATSTIRERQQMTEKEYVNFLFCLRGYNGAPKDILDKLNG